MRTLSYILLALGIYLLGHALYDECSGVTHQPISFFYRRHTHSGYLYSIPVRRDNNPQLFHEFMVKHWVYGGLMAGLGLALYLTTNKPEDPATPDATADDPD